MRAIIMAGGEGKRLLPYTSTIPKPLVTIGGEKIIIEIIITQLRNAGFDHVTIMVNHLADLIMTHLGDGSKYGIHIDYVSEKEPLSTIGPLTLIEDLPENFLVVNGDTLTNIDYQKLFNEHINRNNKISVAAIKREVKIDFGVLEFDKNQHLVSFSEKPSNYSYVALGVNCLHRSVVENLTKGVRYGFDNLMDNCIMRRDKVWVYNFDDFWLDIGRPEDYHYVNENYNEIKKKLRF